MSTLKFNKIKPLYIWAGGKKKMIPKYHFSPGIPLSGYDVYVEPFFGGGAMMCWLYNQGVSPKKWIINDINSELIGIYSSIQNDCENFIIKIDDLSECYLPLNKDERKKFYYDLRDQYTQNWTKWNKTEESSVLYFLMKTGFNGIWQTNKKSNGRFATPSGLLNQENKVYDKENVLNWEKFLQNVDINCSNWKDVVKNISEKSFYFIDPPYRGCFTSYGVSFSDEDHIDLINFCNQKAKNNDYVFYCARDTDDTFYEDNKGILDLEMYDVSYTAGRRKKTDEGYSAKVAKEVLLYHSPKNTFNSLFQF